MKENRDALHSFLAALNKRLVLVQLAFSLSPTIKNEYAICEMDYNKQDFLCLSVAKNFARFDFLPSHTVVFRNVLLPESQDL